MAFLDLDDVLLDPEITVTFNVTRRSDVVDSHGRSKKTPQTFTDVLGVIAVASPADLERLDDAQQMGRHISIVTNFELRGPARDPGETDSQPDLIVWKGTQYLIQDIEPYPQFGDGWVQAIAGSISAIDRTP